MVHIGLVKDDVELVMQVRDGVDFLSPDLWRYEGERDTTAEEIIARLQDGMAPGFLEAVNGLRPEDWEPFTSIRVETGAWDAEDYIWKPDCPLA